MSQVLQSASTLFHVLLVEDDRDLNTDLRLLLEDTLHGVNVASAETVKEALSHLNDDKVFSLAILDIRVPRDHGFHPEASQDIPRRLKEKKIAALCMTGFKGSPDVDDFLRSRALEDPPVAVIEKNLSGRFVDDLIDRVRVWLTALASRNVRRLMEQTFEETPQRPAPGFGTAELMSLQQTIIDYWMYLDPKVRQEIAERFDVREHQGKITGLGLKLGER